jgi:Ca2+/Na+ antiporter
VPSVAASHFLFMVLYALLVSVVFAMLLRDDRREQLKTGAMMFGGFIVAALALSWLMFPLPL